MERASGGRRREEALVNGLRRWRLRGSVGAEARQCPLNSASLAWMMQRGTGQQRWTLQWREHRRHHTTLIATIDIRTCSNIYAATNSEGKCYNYIHDLRDMQSVLAGGVSREIRPLF